MARSVEIYTDRVFDDRGTPYTRTIKSYSGFKTGPFSTPKINGKYVKPTSYNASWSVQDFGTVKFVNRTGSYTQPIEAPPQSYYNPLGGSLALFENLQNKAIANGGEQRLQLGEYFGELPQSAKMIARRATQIADFGVNLKKGNLKGAASTLGLGPWRKPGKKWRNVGKDASDLFLEFKYGWMPLLSDVHDSMEIIHGEVQVPSETGIITGGATDHHTETFVTHSQYGLVEPTYSAKAERRSRMKYSFTHPSRLRTLNQLGLLNPLDIAWNLTGMSFVADWFLPVGDYLKAFSAPTGTTPVDGYNSIYSVITYSAGLPGDSRSLTYGRAVQAPTREDGVFQRYGLLPSQMRPQLPQFRAPKSIDQAVSAVALVTQRFGKR